MSERCLLYLGNVAFDSLRQRPQRLAIELARRTPVLWVDPHRSWARGATPGADPDRATAAGEEALPAHLMRLAPEPAPAFSGYLPPVNRAAYAATARRARAELARRDLSPRAIVASFPKHVDLLDHFPGVPVLYDVMDDYPGFFDPWQRAVLAAMHRRLLARADVVTVSSATLERECRARARRVERIGNGIEPEFHRACADAPPDPAIAALSRPCFGYLGVIADWFDFGAVRALARAFPEGSVALIGPHARALPRLPSNVHALGTRPRAALPGALRALDAGIIPFRRSALTAAANPLKLYEYFSAGLPVVSSALPEVAAMGTLVTIPARAEQWPAAARAALDGAQDPAARARRRGMAGRHLWPQSASAMWALLEALPTARA